MSSSYYSRPHVFKIGYDWYMECSCEQGDSLCAEDWITVMEAAYGHMAMCHYSAPFMCEHLETIRPVFCPWMVACADCFVLVKWDEVTQKNIELK